MSNTPSQLVFWPHFQRELKRLKRKYPRVEEDLRNAIASSSTCTDAVPGYAHRLWKVRIPSRDQRRGTRGGFRLYLWVEFNTPPNAETLYPVTLYPKSEREDLSADELRAVIKRFYDWVADMRSGTGGN